MTDNIPTENDLSADWPEEVKNAYKHLKIPSLYEAVLANEKISFDIRKQNRELKTLTDGMSRLTLQLQEIRSFLREEWELIEEAPQQEENEEANQEGLKEYLEDGLTDLEIQLISDKQASLEKSTFETLMETHDTMRELSKMAKQLTHQLLELLPKKEGILARTPAWHSLAKEMVQSFVGVVDRARYQLINRLRELSIEMIDPQAGDFFDAALHRAIEQITPGPSGTIVQVIRVGYRQEEQVLRLAEVIVYR